MENLFFRNFFNSRIMSHMCKADRLMQLLFECGKVCSFVVLLQLKNFFIHLSIFYFLAYSNLLVDFTHLSIIYVLFEPLVGHNCLLDLTHLHQTLIGDCPDQLCDWKRSIRSHFDCVFDTRLIAGCLNSVGVLLLCF